MSFDRKSLKDRVDEPPLATLETGVSPNEVMKRLKWAFRASILWATKTPRVASPHAFSSGGDDQIPAFAIYCEIS